MPVLSAPLVLTPAMLKPLMATPPVTVIIPICVRRRRRSSDTDKSNRGNDKWSYAHRLFLPTKQLSEPNPMIIQDQLRQDWGNDIAPLWRISSKR